MALRLGVLGMVRKGFTLTEALMAILILGVGLLSLMALYPLALLNIQQALRNNRVHQAAANARAILEIYSSQLPPLPSSGSFRWWYQPAKTPELPLPLSVDITITSSVPPLQLDVEGPYHTTKQDMSGGVPVFYPSPVLTGYRSNPPDPVRYTWAYLVRAVDAMLADVTVVVFEDYDDADASHKPSALPGVSLEKGATAASGAPRGLWTLDVQNGYLYRVIADDYLEVPARANSTNVYKMPRVVDAVELGIIRLGPKANEQNQS